MERWLSKSRVLVGLCVVLLVAALNRQDPMVYAMFLFLLVVLVLGYALPWLSLLSTRLQLGRTGELELLEGQSCQFGFAIVRSLPWPAFMVDVETEWEWAGKRLVLRDTLAVVRAGVSDGVGRHIRFPCRGVYRLVAVRLSSGFPLGLVRAHRSMAAADMEVRVVPAVQTVQWPVPWSIAEDPLGELSTRRLGQSMELGMLRPYQYGEPVGRVSWRASARVGELVVQHFQQSGSVRLHVVVDVPHGADLGDAEGAGEQTLRLAAGICQAALAHSAKLFVHLDGTAHALRALPDALNALAQALPVPGGLGTTLARLDGLVVAGEQLAVVVAAHATAPQVLAALACLERNACTTVLCIAIGRRADAAELRQALALEQALQAAGFATVREAP